jgi:hypothetical protein
VRKLCGSAHDGSTRGWLPASRNQGILLKCYLCASPQRHLRASQKRWHIRVRFMHWGPRRDFAERRLHDRAGADMVWLLSPPASTTTDATYMPRVQCQHTSMLQPQRAATAVLSEWKAMLCMRQNLVFVLTTARSSVHLLCCRKVTSGGQCVQR